MGWARCGISTASDGRAGQARSGQGKLGGVTAPAVMRHKVEQPLRVVCRVWRVGEQYVVLRHASRRDDGVKVLIRIVNKREAKLGQMARDRAVAKVGILQTNMR